MYKYLVARKDVRCWKEKKNFKNIKTNIFKIKKKEYKNYIYFLENMNLTFFLVESQKTVIVLSNNYSEMLTR